MVILVAHGRGGVEARPFAGRDGNLGKLLFGRPEFMHVAARGKRIAADRLRNAPDVLELHRQHRRAPAERTAAFALLDGAVRTISATSHRPFFDRQRRMGHMGLEGRAAKYW